MRSQSLPEGLVKLKYGLITEWRKRTWWGKLWYPMWLLKFGFIIVFLSFIGLLMAFVRGLNKDQEPIWEIYKDDE